MPLDSGNGSLAGHGGICPGPHQLHGQVTVGMIACGKHQAGLTSAIRATNQDDDRDVLDIMAWDKSDANKCQCQEIVIKYDLKKWNIPTITPCCARES